MVQEPAIDDIARTFEDAAPQEILAWAVRTYGRRVALACSFGGPSGMALLDMLVKIDPLTPVYYLDTDLLFPETYAHIARVASHYGITPFPVHSERSVHQQSLDHGPALWERDPDLCCDLRKIEPQKQFLKAYSAWISGIRRDRASSPRTVRAVEWDKTFELIKINPLATWTEEMVWTYVHAHDVPYNTLHDSGYPSIGCTNCTVRVKSGDPLRAGRWQGFAKTECGLHR
jgi:phosphoadenosine phosphosulfate reductase